MSKCWEGAARKASSTVIRLSPSGWPIPCNSKFIAHSRAVASTISQPRNASSRKNLFWSGSSCPFFM